MNRNLVPFSEVSTDQVADERRVAFWESYNASSLIGLRCSAFAANGLRARARSFDLGEVRITELCGNEHVVERTQAMLRTFPKDSIFACLMLEGEGFFFQSGQCLRVREGDVIAYGTDIPYLYGFARDSRQLIIQLDAAPLCESGAAVRPRRPIKLDGRLRSGRLLASTLRSTVAEFVTLPYIDEVQRVSAKVRCLICSLIANRGQHPDAVHTDLALWQLMRAETYIAENLSDHALGAASVALSMNVSVRHLNRLFAARESTVTEWIWAQRLARAHEDLGSARMRCLPVGEVAFRWGFASQAHFARTFKDHYGLTPTQYRRQVFVRS